MNPSLDATAIAVLRCFPQAHPITPIEMSTIAGGFSGATIWLVETLLGRFCLRAWPPGMTEARLAFIHVAQRELTAARVLITPQLLTSHSQMTWEAAAGRYWEVSSWQPGVADFHQRPSQARLRNALRSLAQVHSVWAKRKDAAFEPSEAVIRRFGRLKAWTREQFGQAETVIQGAEAQVRALLTEALACLRQNQPFVIAALEPWLSRPLPQQCVLADVWHDHLLFTGDDVTGLVDFGSARLDNVAVDLARLLESCVGQDQASWATAVACYREQTHFGDQWEGLMRTLIKTGPYVGLEAWLRWLLVEKRHFADADRVRTRLQELLAPTRMKVHWLSEQAE